MREAGRRERAGVGVLAAVAAVRRSVRGAGAVARVASGGLVEGRWDSQKAVDVQEADRARPITWTTEYEQPEEYKLYQEAAKGVAL